MQISKILFWVSALACIGGAAARPLGEPRKLGDAERALVIRSVEEKLKDPDSAKFRWFNYNGHRHYCGQINAKNSYGGYIGYTHFLVDVEKDADGKISKASNPQILGPDTPGGSVMLMICEIAAKADTEDKAVAPAEP